MIENGEMGKPVAFTVPKAEKSARSIFYWKWSHGAHDAHIQGEHIWWCFYFFSCKYNENIFLMIKRRDASDFLKSLIDPWKSKEKQLSFKHNFLLIIHVTTIIIILSLNTNSVVQKN